MARRRAALRLSGDLFTARYGWRKPPEAPAKPMLGPLGETFKRRAMAEAMGVVSATYGTATILATEPLPSGDWLLVLQP